MKHVVWLSCSLIFSLTILAQDYKPVETGSEVSFVIKNLGFDVKGKLGGLKGTIHFDPANPATARFEISLDVNTINTDNSMRDEHLKKEGYFDASAHPLIQFSSTEVKAGDKAGSYLMNGKLTIKNTTKDISFPFIATASGNDYIFKGSFKINRKDFDIGGTSTISNSLTISTTVLARK